MVTEYAAGARNAVRSCLGIHEGDRLAVVKDREREEIAERIAGMARPIAKMVKEAVNRAYETTLAEGVRFERRLFHSTFATEDRKEGMVAFIEKRKPAFRNR